MNGETAVLKTDALIFPAGDAPMPDNGGQIFDNLSDKITEKFVEGIDTECWSVSENETKIQGTRFARLKKSLRKRSASIL